MKITEKIRKLAKKGCENSSMGKVFGLDAYNSHLIPVRDFAIKLARIYHADREVVELAALLHDLQWIKDRKYEIHEITGAENAVKVLRKFGYPEDKIQKVKACILTHRGSKKSNRETIEQKIMASADAMDHINDIAHMFYQVCKRREFKDAIKWTFAKLERGWKKIELPVGRKIVRKKYIIARNFFKAFLK